jgi:predicted RNase H-like HicB family nuclease
MPERIPVLCITQGLLMTVQRFTAIIYWEADEDGQGGVYVAESPEVGTASQGDTIEEALANLTEATALYLEERGPIVTRQPFVTTFEVDDAALTPRHG